MFVSTLRHLLLASMLLTLTSGIIGPSFFGTGPATPLATGGYAIPFPITATTTTNAGPASMGVSSGVVGSLTAVSPSDPSVAKAGPALAGFNFPFGFFSFRITGILVGQTVSVEFVAPNALPSGTVWMKVKPDGSVVTISPSNIFGNLMTFPLTDGGVSDSDGVANAVIVDPGAPGVPPTPFASFSAKVEIEKNAFEVKSTFTLGAGSDGIHPTTEPVFLQVGTFSTTIPTGSFKQDKEGRFKLEGTIGGVALEAVIRPLGGSTFEFKAEGQGADLTGTVNPVTVRLVIGNDGGSTTVTAEFEK